MIVQLRDMDAALYHLRTDNGDLEFVTQGRVRAVFDRTNAAQLARIYAHYALTGELCETPPPVAEDAPRLISATDARFESLERLNGSLENRIEHLERCYAPFSPEIMSEIMQRLAALEAQHAPGHAHRAGEPHGYSAVPVCECGCSLDDHARDTQARSVVLGCEKCGRCNKFRSAEVRYMEA